MVRLSDLVGDTEKFLTERLGKKALFRGGAVAEPGEIASVGDIDRVITGSVLRTPGIRVVKGGNVVPPDRYTSPSTYGYAGLGDVIDPAKVVQHYRGGATLVLGTVNLLLPRLNELCKSVEMDLGHPVDANIYVAPPDAQAFDVHCDAQDIIVIQVHGDKNWTLFDDIVADPGGGKVVPDRKGASSSYELHTGDVLYVPRGMPHLVRTATSASIHVTISINTLTWADLLKEVVAGVLRSDEYAAPLPMGAGLAERIEPLVKRYADRLAADVTAAATADSVHRTIYRRPAYGEGHQAGLLRSALIGGDAPSDRIVLRPGTWPLITTGADTCLIEAGGRRYRVPAPVARACSLLGYGPMSVADLSADPEEAAEIAATLIGLGLAEQAGSRS